MALQLFATKSRQIRKITSIFQKKSFLAKVSTVQRFQILFGFIVIQVGKMRTLDAKCLRCLKPQLGATLYSSAFIGLQRGLTFYFIFGSLAGFTMSYVCFKRFKLPLPSSQIDVPRPRAVVWLG